MRINTLFSHNHPSPQSTIIKKITQINNFSHFLSDLVTFIHIHFIIKNKLVETDKIEM